MEALHDMIRRFEGLRLKPYLCPAGVQTIGYGHTGADVSMSMPAITKEKAEELMLKDAALAMRVTLKLSPVLKKHPTRACAIADFIFNLGPTRYKASTLKRRVDAERWDDAKLELARWVFGGGKKLPGLVARRAAEAALL